MGEADRSAVRVAMAVGDPVVRLGSYFRDLVCIMNFNYLGAVPAAYRAFVREWRFYRQIYCLLYLTQN
jgi:hypothetical protein